MNKLWNVILLMSWAVACPLLAGDLREGDELSPDRVEARFEAIWQDDWDEVFFASGVSDWSRNWVMDGAQAQVTCSEDGMLFSAGSVAGDHSGHGVLWTRQSFSGDIKVEYEYTKMDEASRYVTIIYLLAEGKGGAFDADILRWNHLREPPAMSTYFDNMNTYHISYAAYGNDEGGVEDDYIRARRYLPEAGRGLEGTAFEPTYARTGLFETGVPHQICIIKKGDDLFMSVANGEKRLLAHWQTDALAPITSGRIGLRHMFTRSARYRNFRVSVPDKSKRESLHARDE